MGRAMTITGRLTGKLIGCDSVVDFPCPYHRPLKRLLMHSVWKILCLKTCRLSFPVDCTLLAPLALFYEKINCICYDKSRIQNGERHEENEEKDPQKSFECTEEKEDSALDPEHLPAAFYTVAAILERSLSYFQEN